MTAEELAEMFLIDEVIRRGVWRARYNIAPSQDIPIIRVEHGRRVLVQARWGLIPHWSKDGVTGGRTINARAETAADKPTFREPMRRRRCLVPAEGFFEWKKLGDGPRPRKQPVFINRAGARAIAFAALWDRWGEEDSAVESVAILTCDANQAMTPIHDRMPIDLPPDAWARWLDPATIDPAAVSDLLRPREWPDTVMTLVTPRVNSPAFDDPACIAPTAAAPSTQAGLFDV